MMSEIAPTVPSGPSQREVNDLVDLFSAHRYAEAEATARQMIQAWPDHGFGWKVLGTVLASRQRYAEALPVIERSLALAPADPETHNSFGVALRACGRFSEAEANYRRAIELKPDYHEAQKNLGNVLQSLGRLSEAEVCYRSALELKRDDHEVHNKLGNILQILGRLAEAEANYRRVIELEPDDHDVYNNLGNILQSLGRPAEAVACYRRALELSPDFYMAHNNLGNALLGLGRASEAEASYRRALELKPELHQVHGNLGSVLHDLGRLSEAEASCREALKLEPNFGMAHSNLGRVLQALGRSTEAEASYRRAVELEPDYHDAHSNLIFTLNYQPDQTAAGLLAEAENYGRRVTSKAHPFSAWPVTPDPSRRLRVGWVSGDLGNHPVSFFLQSFLAELSREQIELYAYPTLMDTDTHTQRLKPLFAVWRPVYGLSDEQLARAIFDDAIDILIDLSGHTANNRLPVFAWKPAPVQVSWLGYFGTTGVPGMDYVLGDPYVTPPEDAAHFSETIWRLPETHLCFTAPDVALDVTPLPALHNGFITFGCFNNLAKMNDAVVAVWAKVLAAVPGSKLFLKAPPLKESSVREHVVQRFAGLGVAAGRLILEGSSPRAEMLEAYGRVDFALDPFPYPGGTVSMEALWMGVPVLTRRGDRFWSRVGEGIARKAGLADWVAADDEDYVKRAASHAAQVSRLSELRAGLRARVLASPMFDAPRFARHFEAALRGMWQRWVSATSGPGESEANALVALFAANRYTEMESLARQMVQRWAHHELGWKALGAVLAAQQRFAEAVPVLQKALELSPPDAQTLNNLGNALRVVGRFSEAEASCRRALELSPDFAEAHTNLGIALRGLGRPSEAEASFRRALELKPDSPQAHANLGVALQEAGRLTEAEASYRSALELNPRDDGTYSNLGVALQALGRMPEAEASLRRAIELRPDAHEAHGNLGNLLKDLGRPSEAEACCRRALELKEDYAGGHNNLGNALQALGRVAEAKASYARALELKPDYNEAHSNLIFTLDLIEGCTIGEQQRERRRWYEQHARKHAASIGPHDNPPDPERKLRVGFVSADFRNHSAFYAFSPTIVHRDRNAFEVVCYSDVKLEDDATARLRRSVPQWRSTLGVSDEALAEQIRRDRIDILVDLSGHSAGNRLPVFARKPAPVQVTAWGHANGTGLETMDYFLADRVAVPQTERSWYAEKIVDLPCLICYEPPAYLPEVAPLPALAGKAFTFGCINRIEKISGRVISLWRRILGAVPEARLLIKGSALDDLEHRQQFNRRLRDAGIGAERVALAGNSSHPEHLKIYHEVDLGLDPFPHGGGISTAEALWMGVPVVALNGSTIPGRVTASILTALQMQDWIAQSDDEYVRIAVEAARDLPRLAHIRGRLRTRLAESAFGDVQRYTRVVESAYRSMWRRWCAGFPAESFEVGVASEIGQRVTSGPGQGEIDHLTAVFSAGRYSEAEAVARHMIQAWPDHGLGWKALGAALAAQQRRAEALPVLQSALALSPSDVELHNKLGNVLSDLGRAAEAQASFRRAIELKPDFHEAYNNLGNALLGSGQLDEAARCFRRAIEIRPDYPLAHNNLGNALQVLGQIDEAERCFRRAVELEPDFHEAHNNLANALTDLGRLSEAEASCRRALELKPDSYETHNNLGNVEKGLGRLAEAEASYRRSLELNPDYPIAHNNLGNALQGLGRLDDAVRCYRRSLELDADYHITHCNLGNALQGLGRLDEALRCYHRALTLKPDFYEAHNDLGNLLKDLGRLSEAEASYRRALELKPDYRDVRSNVLFTLNYSGKLSRAELFEEHLAWARRHEAPHAAGRRPHANARDAHRRLRVGYVSPDFRDHSVAFFIEPVLATHDRNAFEVCCYSNVVNPGSTTQRLLALADGARSIVGMRDADAAELVRGDGIDILVDLAGHTANGPLGLFALKPAPVQVAYLGYPNTTGLSAIDWRLTDVHADPPGEGDAFSSERLVRLPETFLCYLPPAEAPAVQPPPLLDGGRITFGSFNVLAKVTPEVIGTWARLLDRVPGSRLMIKALGLGDSLGREQLLGEFGQHGVSGERVILVAKDAGYGAHFARYHEVDIALDPFPYNGTTTTFDALWMGVPVVSLAGERHAARVGASILTNLGLEELIAHSVEEYLALAAGLAMDAARLARLRETMRARMSASPVLDGARLARHIEAAYREMWRRWCSNEYAVAFDVFAS